MTDSNYHVVLNVQRGGWDIIREEGAKASRHFETQKEAVDFARALSEKAHVELIVHGKNGEIKRRDSHGNDPFPPKG